MYGRRKNPMLEEMSKDIEQRYGILVSAKALGELLHLKRTATWEWIQRNGLIECRRAHYYCRDIARALIENGGVPK